MIGGVASSSAASKAAKSQNKAADASIAMQERQLEATRELLSPFVQAGAGTAASPGGQFDAQAYLAQNPDVAADPYYSQNPQEHYNRFGKAEGRQMPLTAATAGQGGSLQAQQDLLGLNGNGAQQTSIDALKTSPLFTSLLQQGENSILQNASATGGLRGGNTQAALAQFSPALLAQVINDQYSKLSGITSLSQNAAAGVGNANLSTGNNISNLLGQMGSANAGAALGQGAGIANAANSAAGGYALQSALARSAAPSGWSLPSNLYGGSGIDFSGTGLPAF
ncbi:hypothetical protein ASF44_16375 [Pseudorhodoferax sp. Leaf274]|nr:hypothetical protein ASF44_16375 [Pseudorhodoferax sp. Leaf274]